MISKDNNYLSEASQALYEFNADEITRQKCLAREDYYRTQNTYKKVISDLQAQVNDFQQILAENKAALAEKDNALEQKDNALEQKDITIAQNKAALAEKDEYIKSLLAQLAEAKN